MHRRVELESPDHRSASPPVPAAWPGREPTPLAGISLAPILAGGAITARPPIHLLFSSDRGLRDGDWKIVSFQSDPWELYDLAKDRTELHDVIAAHPDVAVWLQDAWFIGRLVHKPDAVGHGGGGNGTGSVADAYGSKWLF